MSSERKRKTPKRKTPQRKRLALYVSPQAEREMERIKTITGAPSFSEVMRLALRFYSLALLAQEEGEVLLLLAPDETERRLFLL